MCLCPCIYSDFTTIPETMSCDPLGTPLLPQDFPPAAVGFTLAPGGVLFPATRI